jgi:hypothetical protein
VNDWRSPWERLGALVIILLATLPGNATDFTSLCADRMAIERVYYNHRLGEKAPFEETMPPSLVERLVRDDQHKEDVLEKVYQVEATAFLVEAEVQRINNTSRAPEVLAEIKRALGNDPDRFARAVARPLVVDRTLRRHFANDARLHEATRRQTSQLRDRILSAKSTNAPASQLIAMLKANNAGTCQERMWHLTGHSKAAASPSDAVRPTFARSADGIYALEGVARLGAAEQQAGPAPAGTELYFDDLPPDLRQVLRTQLRKPGDTTAVIETPDAFLLFVATQTTAETLAAASVSIAKRRFDEWLANQSP